MEPDSPSPKQENNEPKAEFRKLTNEAANRKYRRHSPVAGSSDEDASPKQDHGSRRDSKVSDYERKHDDRVDEKNSRRSQHGRSSDSYRHSSRGYHNRHDDYSRHGKHADEDDRSHAKSFSRSGRESRGGTHSDNRDRESEHNRSRDHYRDVDKYSRDRSDVADRKYKDKNSSSDRTGYDGRHGSRYDDRDRHARDRDDREDKRDYKSSRDYRSDRTFPYEDSRGHRNDSSSKRGMGDVKDLDGSKSSQEEKIKSDGLDSCEARPGGAGARSDDRSAFVSEDFGAKRPKLFSMEETDARKDERFTPGSKQEQAPVNGSDSGTNVDAAKVAAMKAAEMVNKNLTSTGFMTADQKKKLLWGNKKNNNTEESSRRWDTAMFSDRERQEKFNKLMGVKGEVKADSRPPANQDAEKQSQLQLDLEKQYTAGLRRRDGRTVGLGL